MVNDILEPARDQRDYAESISVLRGNLDPKRRELISDVVGAYGRLQDSVRRFLRLLAGTLGDIEHGEHAEALRADSFDDLLTALYEHAQAVDFGRMDALQDVIDAAHRAGKSRHVVFVDPFGGDGEALRVAATEMDRLDRTLVGLCVQHVIEARERSARVKACMD
jgi:hypothetical protein